MLVATDFGDESQFNTYPLSSQMLLGLAPMAGMCGEWTGIGLNGAEKGDWGADGKALPWRFLLKYCHDEESNMLKVSLF